MRRNHNQRNFMFGAMLGSTLGALTALMFTTKKGHRIQKDVADKFHEFEGIVKSYAKGQKKTAQRALHKLAKTVDQNFKKAKRKAHSVKRKVKRKAHQVKRKVKRRVSR